MKTAKEFLQNKYPSMREHWNETSIDDNWVASMMEEYAAQCQQENWTSGCKCDESTGAMWCCNICGKPTEKQDNAECFDVDEIAQDIHNELYDGDECGVDCVDLKSIKDILKKYKNKY